MRKIGLIGGGGALPFSVLKEIQAQGDSVVIIGLEGQTDPTLVSGYDHLWVKIGQVGRVLDKFRGSGVSHVVLAGYVRRPSWTEMGLDRVGLQWVGGFFKKSLGDDGILTLIGEKLKEEGFQLLSASSLCPSLRIGEGAAGTVSPSARALDDIEKGVSLIRGLYGTYDIGQAVVIQEGLVLGVEAIEGTDALIRRCGALKREGEGPVLIKLPKPGQSREMDMPTVGMTTLDLLIQEGFQGMALEADGTLVLDLVSLVEKANKAGCFLWGVPR